jgi:hypothetical protein
MIKTLFKSLLATIIGFVVTTSALAVPNYYVQHAAQPWNGNPGRLEWYWTPAYEPASVLLRLDTTPISCQPVTVSIGSQMVKDKTYILRVVFIYGFRDYDQFWLEHYYPHAFANVAVWDNERGDWVERLLPTPPMDWYGDYVVGCDYKIRATLDTNGEVILSAFLLNVVYGWKPDIQSPVYAPAVYTVQEIENALGHPCIAGGW